MSSQISSAGVSPPNAAISSIMGIKTLALNPESIKEVDCPDCGGGMNLREGKYGLSYFCNNFPLCKGNHRASKRGKPMGVPANKETRGWRIKAHRALEALYKGKGRVMTKTEAYALLSHNMGLSKRETHISRFNLEQCKEVVEILNFK